MRKHVYESSVIRVEVDRPAIVLIFDEPSYAAFRAQQPYKAARRVRVSVSPVYLRVATTGFYYIVAIPDDIEMKVTVIHAL